MKQGMKESYEKGVANRSAPSFALHTARCSAKRKQGYRWAGYRASKRCNQDADAFALAEGNTAFSGPLPMDLSGLESAGAIDKKDVRAARFRIVWIVRDGFLPRLFPYCSRRPKRSPDLLSSIGGKPRTSPFVLPLAYRS